MNLAPAEPASALRRACLLAPPVAPRRTRKPFFAQEFLFDKRLIDEGEGNLYRRYVQPRGLFIVDMYNPPTENFTINPKLVWPPLIW